MTIKEIIDRNAITFYKEQNKKIKNEIMKISRGNLKIEEEMEYSILQTLIKFKSKLEEGENNK